VIDLGPEGRPGAGRTGHRRSALRSIVTTVEASYTGQYLKQVLPERKTENPMKEIRQKGSREKS